MTDKEKVAFYLIIGGNIKTAREKRGLKQHALAEMLGLSRASVVNIEKGRQHVSLHTLWQMSTFLNVDFIDLIKDLGIQAQTTMDISRIKFDASFTTQSEKDSAKRGIQQFIETLKQP